MMEFIQTIILGVNVYFRKCEKHMTTINESGRVKHTINLPTTVTKNENISKFTFSQLKNFAWNDETIIIIKS